MEPSGGGIEVGGGEMPKEGGHTLGEYECRQGECFYEREDP